MLSARRLKNAEVFQFKSLLYQIYTSLGWKPPEKNPSNWRVESEGPQNIYLDDFDLSSTYFGLFDKKTLIGGCRVIDPIHEKLEFELYHRIPSRFLLKNRVEMNRFALKEEYLNGPAALALWITVLDEMLKRSSQPRMFISIFSEELIEICKRLGFNFVDPTARFKYFPSDPNFCQILYIDTNDKEKTEEIITRCRQLEE